MKYRGLVIADVHIGAVKPIERAYKEIKDLFLSYIENHGEEIDFIIICGDFFNNKRYLNDMISKMAYKVLYELLSLCKKYKIKLRIVYGTESHECNQYDILESFKEDFDVRIIRRVTEEALFEDLNVLYLPEEIVSNQEEYYQDYFSNRDQYDYVFGHGIIREVMKEASLSIENKKNSKRHVPIFKSSELDKITKGEVYFGHYHIHTNIQDKIFYVGSYSRWMFGEEEEKGFYDILVDTKKEKYSHTFIPNTLCETYKTIRFGYSNKIFKDPTFMEEELNRFDKILEDDFINHIRFEFNIPETAENPEFIINYVKERYKFRKDVKVQITNGYIEKKKQTSKEKIDHLLEKYDMILDKEIPIEDKISYFIHVSYDKDIDTEKTKKYLNDSLKDIIQVEGEN